MDSSSTRPPFEPYLPPRPAIYPRMRVFSTYIAVRDGTRLAADIYLPAPLPAGQRLPAVLQQTRYWRSSEMRPPLSWILPREGEAWPVIRKERRFLTGHGYAVIVVDVRGTGASFGQWRYPWEPITVQDSYDLVEWITRQPWSNGRVAGTGISYMGTTAELLLVCGHPAVRAIVPMFNHPDPYTDISFPGGLFNQRFVRAWSRMDEALDLNRPPDHFGKLSDWMTLGVRPVNGSRGRAALAQAVLQHQNNGRLHDLPAGLLFRDEVQPQAGYRFDDVAPLQFQRELLSSPIPVFAWGSWMDAGTAQAVLRRFHALPAPTWAVIGAWNHGGFKTASPYLPEDSPLSPPIGERRWQQIRFLDIHLKQPPDPRASEKSLYYYTVGEEAWHAASAWPPPGISTQRWFFDDQRRLVPQPPSTASQVEYTVDFRATTGTFNRWWELGVVQGRSVNYGDRSTQKKILLAFETPPLEHDLEISGSPVLTLWVASTEPDGAFYAYLEDVLPDGRILCLTEGQLRAVHRRVIPAPPGFDPSLPYHSFRSADALPLVPGQLAEIRFALLPLSALLRRGHRLRLALAGHDEGTFDRVPARAVPRWTIHCGPPYPSSLDLPQKIR